MLNGRYRKIKGTKYNIQTLFDLIAAFPSR